MDITPAGKNDCLAIAELAMMAGEGIPAYFWEQSRQSGEGLYPEFIRPCIELENQVPGSFYINMLASYPQFRDQGNGTKLMAEAERQARERACNTLSIQVFEENQGALRLYQRLGYTLVDQRDLIPHPCFRYTGQVLLLTKKIDLNPN